MKKRNFFVIALIVLTIFGFHFVFLSNETFAQLPKSATSFFDKQSNAITDKQPFYMDNQFQKTITKQKNLGFSNRSEILRGYFQKPFNLNETLGFTTLHYQSVEITDDIAYQQLFRILLSFEKEANKQASQGFSQRSQFLRNYFQKKSGLSFEQTKVLKDYASNYTNQFGCISNSSEFKNKTSDENGQAILEYRNRIRRLLGESVFDKFDRFVQEKIASRLIYTEDLTTQTAFFGFSMVDYDAQSNEVIGYSYTDQPSGHCQIIENIVNATLTSDADGEVDSDSATVCDGSAEVYLYFSNPQPEDQFCIDGEHGFVRVFIPQLNNINRESNLGVCSSGEKQGLPASEDCLTTPSLPNVTGIDFQQIPTNNAMPIDDNPNVDNDQNTEDGRRIFPDDDVPNENQNRQTIRLVAGISEQRAGVTVYFRNFDLDDPSTDMTIDPNGTTENDNNGNVGGSSAGQLSSMSAVTNSQGIATVNFTVTMQPGDNFAIAASTDQDELNAVTVNGIDLQSSSGTVETNCDGTDLVCRSEMLTVWRRLHIEVDSMGESTQNFVLGNTASSGKIRRFQQMTLNVNTANDLEPNRFENGRFLYGSDSLRVVSNTTDTVTVENTNFQTISIIQNGTFQLFDDDDFDDDDGTILDGDTGEDIPDVQEVDADTLLQSNDTVCDSISATNCNVFFSSYIRPVYDIPSDTSDNNFFQEHTPNNLSDIFGDFNQDSTQADLDYWTIYLYGTYQRGQSLDADPRDENITNPFPQCPIASYGRVDAIGPNGQGATVNMEVGRPREYPTDYASRPVSRAWTAAHEVGHLFGGIHDDGGIMAPSCERMANEFEFDPDTIRRLRATITHP